MEKRKTAVFLPLILSLILVAGIFVGQHMKQSNTTGYFFSVKYTESDKLKDVLNYIEKDYVDTVNAKVLTEKTIESMLGTLDPHSSYIPPRNLEEVEESMAGRFYGIGIQYRNWHDTVVVVMTIDDGPSEKAGLQAGDRIISANGINITGGLPNDSIVKLLKGPAGSSVRVGVLRHGLKSPRQITIRRGMVPVRSLQAAYLADSNAYFKIDRFAATTYDELMSAARKLGKNNYHTVIIDLQDNGGGLLSTAKAISDEFLPAGDIIVYTMGRKRDKDISYASDNEAFKGKHVKVLVNENSASASEIFAGAIQDNDRGEIIGRRTFGKGLVQEQIELPDHSAIRLTVARYYTPVGRCIQKPFNGSLDDYYHELSQRYIHGEMTNADSASFSDSLKYTTAKGKVLYGGGGIMPDRFVPLNTNDYSFFNSLQRSGAFYDFAFEYVDKHRQKLLEQYPDEDLFVNNFKVSNALLRQLYRLAESKGVVLQNTPESSMTEEIKARLKGQIASDIYGSNAYYKIVNPYNEIYSEALKP